jgi:hypothetical protein
MKFLNERVLIREVAQRWAEQYSGAHWRKDKETQDIVRKLKALDPETATAADVAAIIGNDSWTRIDHCDECRVENLPEAVMLADDSSSSATVCLPCLRKAVKLARSEREEQQ